MPLQKSILKRILIWRLKHIPHRQFVLILSVIIGLISGLGAALIKNVTFEIKTLLEKEFIQDYFNVFYFIFPFIGFSISYLVSKFAFGHQTGQGISDTLFAISRKNGQLPRNAMFAPLITAPFTVGFGGSVGLEGATVYTGSAIGSNLARFFHMNNKTVVLMISCAAAGALSSVFHAPIGAIIFAIEIFSLDFTMVSLVPMLLASTAGAITSILIVGDDTIFKFIVYEKFKLKDMPFYLILSIVGALNCLYFSFMYRWTGKMFSKISKRYVRLILGASILGVVIYVFPSLYGEGYSTIKALLSGRHHLVMQANSWTGSKNIFNVILLLSTLAIVKAIATTATIGAVRIGGLFGPSLMSGCCMGYAVALLINFSKIGEISPTNFALIGMATQMAGVMFAPLTAIFMISELTGTYDLMIPLMMCCAITFSFNRYFNKYNAYQSKLASIGALITHDKDKAILTMMEINKVIENNFTIVRPDWHLRQILINGVALSTRNIFPVVDFDNTFLGVITLDDLKEMMFDESKYDIIGVSQLMHTAPDIIHPKNTMEEIMEKFQNTSAWNLPVCDENKYLGFISKSKVLSIYRRKLIDFAGEA